MITCIILNYNDCESTMNLYYKILNYQMINMIIIVDNCSTDNSFEKLSKLANSKTKVVKSDCNGGYGMGNNIGLKISHQIGATYSIVCNPDIEFTESALNSSLQIIRKNSNCIAVSPKVNKGNIGYKFASNLGEIAYSNLLLNKIFKPRYYNDSYFENKEIAKVDVIPGSFTIFDLSKFIECGLYDEDVFLYNEEIIIGKRFKEKGYEQLIDLKNSYIHNHSVSVNKNIKSSFKLKKINMDSQKIYMKKYCHANIFIILLHNLIRPINYFEMMLWRIIKTRGVS